MVRNRFSLTKWSTFWSESDQKVDEKVWLLRDQHILWHELRENLIWPTFCLVTLPTNSRVRVDPDHNLKVSPPVVTKRRNAEGPSSCFCGTVVGCDIAKDFKRKCTYGDWKHSMKHWNRLFTYIEIYIANFSATQTFHWLDLKCRPF